MKRSLFVILITIMLNNSYAYTIGDSYFGEQSNLKMNQSSDYSYYNNILNNKYVTKDNITVSTNDKNIITGIGFNGKNQETLKIALGKYYVDYKILSKNSQLNNVSNNYFSVSSYSTGNGMLKTEVLLKSC